MVSARLGVAPAGELEQRADVIEIFLLLRGELRLQVIVAIRQTQAALDDVERVARRVLEIDIDAEIEETAFEIFVRAAHERSECIARLRRAHGIERGRQWLGPQGFDARLIHERFVERADLAFEIGGRVRRFRRRGFHELVQAALGLVGHGQS